MKVRVGRSGWTTFTSASELERQISETILKGVSGELADVGNRRLRHLAEIIKDVATEEAHKLFTVLVDLIDQEQAGTSYAGFASAALTMGTTLDWSFNRNQLGGRVEWPALNDHYYKFKRRHQPSHANQFFQFSGRLRAYFNNQGVSIVDNRLGGVDVTPIIKKNEGELQLFTRAASEPGERTVEDVLLGKIEIKIFPRVAPSLLPGLASHRWTEVLMDGSFEKDIFGNLRTGQKLANKDGRYRALVAPAVQFWILTRIPNAIFRRVRTYFNKSGPRDE
ncbi:MAG: hypothetical protein ACREEW_13270 [Caulobacteraceae bacterium]